MTPRPSRRLRSGRCGRSGASAARRRTRRLPGLGRDLPRQRRADLPVDVRQGRQPSGRRGPHRRGLRHRPAPASGVGQRRRGARVPARDRAHRPRLVLAAHAGPRGDHAGRGPGGGDLHRRAREHCGAGQGSGDSRRPARSVPAHPRAAVPRLVLDKGGRCRTRVSVANAKVLQHRALRQAAEEGV